MSSSTYTLIETWSDGYRCTCCRHSWDKVSELTYEEASKVNWSWWNAFNDKNEDDPNLGLELISKVLKYDGKVLKEAYLSYPDMNRSGRSTDRNNRSTWTIEQHFAFGDGCGVKDYKRTVLNYVKNTPDKLYRWALSSGELK